MGSASHLLRQELNGGYWLIRDEGRAVELDHHDYRWMAQLVETSRGLGHSKLDWSANGVVGVAPSRLVNDLSRYGLRIDDPAHWEQIRVVPLPQSLAGLPMDCDVAPKRIYFELTRRCNLACSSCFNNSRHPVPGELTFEEIIDVNRQAEMLGVFEIRYTGGECTLVPGFADIVTDARTRGLFVSVGTNGVYTDEQLDRLPDSGIDLFIISLDGDRQANDKVRGRGSFDAVLRTLRALTAYPHIRVRLNMVVAKHNMAAIEAVAAIAAAHQVGSLNLIPLRPYGRATRRLTSSMFQQADFYDFVRAVNALRKRFPEVMFSTTIDLLDPEQTTSHDLLVQKKRTCAAGVEACVIGPQGHVYGCSYSPASFPDTAEGPGSMFIAGNVRHDSLAQIWRDSARWSVFRDLTLYKNSKCHTCSHYTTRCSGSCPIMSYYAMQHSQEVGAGSKNLADFYDPYCFVDLLEPGNPASPTDPLAEPRER